MGSADGVVGGAGVDGGDGGEVLVGPEDAARGNVVEVAKERGPRQHSPK